MDSHRRLDLLAQFVAADLTLIGLQETRCRRPRAKDSGPHKLFSSAAGPRGQAGLELWAQKTWLRPMATQLVVHADQRLLMVILQTHAGIVQVVVAHAPDSTYPEPVRQAWWATTCTVQKKMFQKDEPVIWLIDANATVGSITSSSVGPVNPETESNSGVWFHEALLAMDLALPATFQSNA